jgi:hypothetical protein
MFMIFLQTQTGLAADCACTSNIQEELCKIYYYRIDLAKKLRSLRLGGHDRHRCIAEDSLCSWINSF